MLIGDFSRQEAEREIRGGFLEIGMIGIDEQPSACVNGRSTCQPISVVYFYDQNQDKNHHTRQHQERVRKDSVQNDEEGGTKTHSAEFIQATSFFQLNQA
jgi:hypothetical protein